MKYLGQSSNDKDLVNKKKLEDAISGKEDTSNKVTSLNQNSTDKEYPSAKCVYNLIGDVETLLSQV